MNIDGSNGDADNAAVVFVVVQRSEREERLRMRKSMNRTANPMRCFTGPRRYLRPISYIYANKIENRNKHTLHTTNERTNGTACWQQVSIEAPWALSRAGYTSNFAYVIVFRKHMLAR